MNVYPGKLKQIKRVRIHVDRLEAELADSDVKAHFGRFDTFVVFEKHLGRDNMDGDVIKQTKKVANTVKDISLNKNKTKLYVRRVSIKGNSSGAGAGDQDRAGANHGFVSVKAEFISKDFLYFDNLTCISCFYFKK